MLIPKCECKRIPGKPKQRLKANNKTQPNFYLNLE